MGCYGPLHWSTENIPLDQQYDVWLDALNNISGHWQPLKPTPKAFSAEVRQTLLPNLAIVECWADPCAAIRPPINARKVGEGDSLTIQLILSGREFMRLGNQEALLTPGDIFVWDDTQSVKFEVLEPLHNISLVLPLPRIEDWLRGDWVTLKRWLRQGESNTEMLASFVQGLSRLDYQANPRQQNALAEAAVAMLVASLPGGEAVIVENRHAQLEIVKSKIMKSLRNPDLNLEKIAKENRISLRYLHKLFEAEGDTPWRFVIQQRLEGCYRDLMNPALSYRSITQIAFSWGFLNSTYFSRKVKSTYGMTPSEIRSHALRRSVI